MKLARHLPIVPWTLASILAASIASTPAASPEPQNPPPPDLQQPAPPDLQQPVPPDQQKPTPPDTLKPASPGVRKPAPPVMTAAWTTTLPASPSAPPAADPDQVYVTLRSGELAAVSLATGTLAWTVAAADTVGSPAAGEGLVFLAYERRLEARDAKTGVERWQLTTDDPLDASPYWNNGWLLVFTGRGGAIMLRAATGEVIWRQSLGAPPAARPGAADERLYVLLDDGRVAALSLQTGETQWSIVLPGRPTSIRVLDDRLFVGCADKYLYCLSANDGKTKWRWRTGAAIVGTASVDADLVYFLSLDGVLRALDRGNGHQRWKASVPNQPTTGPFLSAGLLLVPGIVAKISAFSARTGRPAGAIDLPAEPAVLPILADTGPGEPARLFVASDDGRLQMLVAPPTSDKGIKPQNSTGASLRPAS